MVKAELGTKRTCPSCGARFYDLLKSPIVCPKCGVSFIAATLLPSKTELPHQAAPKPREVVKEEPEETADVELVSLEDAEEGAVPEDDEVAVIEDVDLGEEAADDAAEDETFLVEDEEEPSDVSGYLDGGAGPKEGNEEEP